MGVRNYLIEGVSGAGKTTVAEELERRGYHVVHGDRKFAYAGDPETGERVVVPAGLSEVEAMRWGYARWIWPLDKVRAILTDRSQPVTFFCGGSRNRHHFIESFDAVFVLDVDPDTLSRRLVGRPDDEFGGKPMEHELVMGLHATQEERPANAVSIDSTQPVARVVDAILAHCQIDSR